MPQRKKNQNKENSKIIKKTTLQQINYTEQLRIPTIAGNDSKQLGRSIELRKSNSKKPASRKSRCISAKQSQPQPPLKLKDLLKQFNSLKLIQSKSKSPKSNKETRSKKGSKGKLKKVGGISLSRYQTKFNTQTNSRTNSQVNLTAKLERTIKKLKQTDYFKDQEDSDIPFVSTSSAFTPFQQEKLSILENQNQEDINIREMRIFCHSATLNNNCRLFKGNQSPNQNHFFKRSIETLKGNIYETMARKIQRAWRRYRTHKLIRQYANKDFFSIIDRYQQSSIRDNETHSEALEQSSISKDHSELMIESQQLYPLQMQQRKITYISNLEESEEEQIKKQFFNGEEALEVRDFDEENEDLEESQEISGSKSADDEQEESEGEKKQEEEEDEECLKQMKLKQLRKWNETIKELEKCSNNPAQRQNLLKKLMLTFQNDMQELSHRRSLPKQSEKIGKSTGLAQNLGFKRTGIMKQEIEFSQSNIFEVQQESNEQDQRKDTFLDLPKKESNKKDPSSRYTRHKKKLSSHSEESMKMIDEEFNSRKYIEYLDSDMYPRDQPQSNNQRNKPSEPKRGEDFSPTISKKKQDLLLMKLREDSNRIANKQIYRGWLANIHEDVFDLEGNIRSRLSYRSSSELSQESSCAFELSNIQNEGNEKNKKNPRSKQSELRKSSSQKIFKVLQVQSDEQVQFKTIEEYQPVFQPKHSQTVFRTDQKQEHLPKKQEIPSKNIKTQLQNHFHSESEESENAEDLLNKFVKKQINQYDFSQEERRHEDQIQKFDRLYSERQLARQLAELKRLKDNDSDLDQSLEQAVNRPQTFKNNSLPVSQPEHQNMLEKQQEGGEQPTLHRTKDHHFQLLHKINIQDYDHNIDSEEQEICQGQFEENKVTLNRKNMNEIPDIAEKAEGLSQIMFQNILIEVLKDMARYPQTILKKFKDYAIQRRDSENQRSNARPANRIQRAPRSKKNGFPTNQAQIRNFSQEIIKYLLNQEPHIFKNLERSTGPSALEMLRYMHQSEEEQIILEEEEDDPSVMVLPNWVFDNYWGRKSLNLKYERQSMILDDERQGQRQEYLKSLNKIFYRSLFDCLNECLDYERNFGPVGRPFPWKKTPLFEHSKNFSQIQGSVKKAEKKLLQITSTYCGIIIERDEMMSLVGSQQYLDQVQQDRLSRMLAQDLVEGEDRWIFYDDQQTELLVQVSGSLYFQVVWEFINQFYLMNFLRLG